MFSKPLVAVDGLPPMLSRGYDKACYCRLAISGERSVEASRVNIRPPLLFWGLACARRRDL